MKTRFAPAGISTITMWRSGATSITSASLPSAWNTAAIPAPEQCYSVLSGSDEIIIIKRGEKGYFKTDIPVTDKDEARSIVNEYNAKLGVSKAQEEAMKAGSMFDFQVPAADPRNYDADGKPVMPKDRGDAR